VSPQVEELNRKAFGGSLDRRDVVGDLGSGYGLMLMLIAALYGSTVIGIEISETRHLGGLQILLELMQRIRSIGERSVELLYGDMLDPEFSGRLAGLTKLIVNNKVRRMMLGVTCTQRL
jgi:cyclopropane fatty-acyl-phospholipid synthase-like methyltransferase